MSSIPPVRPNPYIGPRAFQTGEALYGRDRALRALVNLLIAERIVLLYSPSGAGKSSLIQAGLIPGMQAEDFTVLPVMRINEPLSRDATGAIRPPNRYLFSALRSLEEAFPPEQRLPPGQLATMSLADYLDHWLKVQPQNTNVRELRAASPSPPNSLMLIFDQFEEIVTVDPTDQDAKLEFFAAVGATLNDRTRWALFSLREDYLAALDPYLRPIPTRLNNTFRLDLLEPDAARQAIQQPAHTAGVDFTSGAVAKLVDDLRRTQVQQPDGSMAEQLGPYVEPVQLQVVCYRLWQHLAPDATRILETDVESVGSVDSALGDYYADCVAGVARETSVKERAIREWFERQLITEQGIRSQVLLGPMQSDGLDNRAIRLLENAHLLRAEKRGGATWFELAHDRLIGPVRKNNAAWFQANLSALQRAAELWDSQRRQAGLLLSGQALTDAERWADEHPDELTPTEEEFLKDCRAVRTAAVREKRQHRRIQWLAIAASLGLVAALIAICTVVNLDRNMRQVGILDHSRAIAERVLAELATSRDLSHQMAVQGQFGMTYETIILLAMESIKTTQAANLPYTVEAYDALQQALSIPRYSKVLNQNNYGIVTAEFSPNGQQIVTASGDYNVRVWDARTGQLTTVVFTNADPIAGAHFSPDGKLIVTASWDGTIGIWYAATGQRMAVLRDTNKLWSAQFSPDGRQIVTTNDYGVQIWDIQARQPTVILRTNGIGPIDSAQFSPNGEHIVARNRTSVRVLNTRTGQQTPIHIQADDITDVQFSPDGKQIITVIGSKVQVWDVQTGQQTALLNHSNSVATARFSPDGQQIVTASWDVTARVWDVHTGQPVALLIHNTYGVTPTVTGAAFSPDGLRIVTTTNDSVRVWNAQTGQLITALHAATYLLSASFSPDGHQIITSDFHQNVEIWDVPTGEHAQVLIHTAPVYNAQYSADGQQIVTTDMICTVRVWDARTGQQTKIFPLRSDWRVPAQFSPDGKRLVTVRYDFYANRGHVEVWDLATGQQTAVLTHTHTLTFMFSNQTRSAGFTSEFGNQIRSAGFTSDSQHILFVMDDSVDMWDAQTSHQAVTPVITAGYSANAVLSRDGQEIVTTIGGYAAQIWDTRTGAKIGQVGDGKTRFSSAILSQDGKLLINIDDKYGAQVWDVHTSRQIALLHGGTDPIVDADFSPDDKQIVTRSTDNTVRIWDAATGEETGLLRGHEASIKSAQFSPDGKHIITAGLDNTARIFWADIDDLMALAQSQVTRSLTCQELVQYLDETLYCSSSGP